MSGSKWVVASVTGAVCFFGIGFWLGNQDGHKHESASALQETAPSPESIEPAVAIPGADDKPESAPITFEELDSRISTAKRYTLIGSLPQSAIEDLLDHAAAVPEEARNRSFDGTVAVLIERLTILNPQVVVDRMSAFPVPEHSRNHWVSEAVRRLVQANPDSAKSLIENTDSEQLIIGELAKQNPSAAAKMADERGMSEMLGTIGKNWGRTDPEAATAYMEGLDAEKRAKFFKGMVAGWARADATAMLDHVTAGFRGDNNFVDGIDRKEVSAAVLSALTGEFFHRGGGGFAVIMNSDEERAPPRPDLAAEWLKTLTVGEQYEANDARSIARAWARTDIDKALSWATSLKDKHTRDEGLTGIVTGIAKTDPVRAAQIFDEAPDDWFKVNEVQPILLSYIKEDSVAAAQWWEKLPLDERVFHLDQQMPAEGYAQVTAFLDALSEPENQLQAFINTGRQWGSVDPVKAVAWAREISNPSIQSTVLKQVLSEFAILDPQGAAEAAIGLGDSPLRAEVFAAAGKNWAKNDPEAALTWATKLDGVDAVNAIDSLIPEVAKSDPAGLAAMLETDGDPVAALVNLPEAAESIARNWSARDPVAAVDWATTQTGSTRNRALVAIAETIGAAQPDTAIDLLEHVSPGILRDGAIEKLARPLARFDPSAAIKLAETLSDEATRTKLVSESYRRWLILDRNTAIGGQQSDAFSEDSRTIFNQTIEQLP